MKIKVKVTEEHLKNGVRGDCEKCPIALALREQFPDEKYLQVDGIGINVGDHHFDTPRDASHFIVWFDNGMPVEIIDFELNEFERDGGE